MIRPISIALVYGGTRSYLYAKIMEELIKSKSNQIPLIPLLVDGSERNGGVMDAIKRIFEPSNRAIVFVSEAYEAHKIGDDKKVGMATPNLMFELGYLYRKLGENSLKIITDFSYEDIKDKFSFPSDLQGQYLCSKKELKHASEEEIWGIFKGILEAELKDIFEKDGIKAGKSIFANYEPRIEALFLREIKNGINEYSLEKQHTTVMNNWISELGNLSNMSEQGDSSKERCIILYSYERLLFLLAFHDTKIEGIDICNLKITASMSKSIMQRPEARLFNVIVDYIVGHSSEMGAPFYIDIADKIECLFDEKNFNSLVSMLVKNYLGLCYLNSAMKISREKSIEFVAERFARAKECFDWVINKARDVASGTLTENVILSFVYYNRARVLSRLNRSKEEWRNDFIQSREIRERMSTRDEFPRFIQLYFLKELYHCINGETHEVLQYYEREDIAMPENERNEYISRETQVLEKLKMFEQTIIAGKPFFEQVKSNAMGNLKKL